MRSTVFFRYILLTAVFALPACALHSPQDPRSEGTRKMAQRLAAIAASNRFVSSKRVAYLKSQLPPSRATTPLKYVKYQIDLSHELLNAGPTQAAIRRLDSLKRAIDRHRLPAYEEILETLEHLRMIAYLRLGEQKNCLLNHTAASCLFPIPPEGVHQFQKGSRTAINLLEKELKEDPDNLRARWLLNIAYMTIGTYPDSMPDQWLIPPSAFASDYDIKRFPDVAHHKGVATPALAGGAVMEDFDRDGDLDIMASSWGWDDQLRYFENNGSGSFTERTKAAGLTGLVRGLNMVQGDYNNDGYPDVFVLRGAWLGDNGRQPNSLLRNNGDGTFSDVTKAAGLLSFHPTQTAAWGDFNNDGYLDLFIGNESTPGSYHPCELYRNNGDGTFTNVAAQVGLDVVGFVKGVAWGDYDNDGLPDLYISQLNGPNLLFHNDGPQENGSWAFTEVGRRAGVREPIHSFATWFWDYNNDGWLDIFVAGYGDGYTANVAHVAAEYLGRPPQSAIPRLYRNNGDGTFTDVTKEAHLYTVLYAMGANYGDLDNDGYLDFYVGTGGPSYASLMPNRMFRNAGGEYFQDVTTSGGFGHLQKGHAVAWGDYDNDGDQDIFAVIGGALEGDTYPNVLFENPGHGNHWLTLRFRGKQSNSLGIGARIKITIETSGGPRTIYRVVSSGGSFGASSLQQEIGLGDALRIRELQVTWPASGTVQTFTQVPMDHIYVVYENREHLVPVEAPS